MDTDVAPFIWHIATWSAAVYGCCGAIFALRLPYFTGYGGSSSIFSPGCPLEDGLDYRHGTGHGVSDF